MRQGTSTALNWNGTLAFKSNAAVRSRVLKLAEVAQTAEISQGMLSKIENAQVSTSLETLSRPM